MNGVSAMVTSDFRWCKAVGFGIGCVVTCILSACGEPGSGDPTASPRGRASRLTYSATGQGAGLTGEYTSPLGRLSFEALAVPNPDWDARAGESSPWVIDVRFLDAAGSPFIVDLGGDGFLDDSWRTGVGGPASDPDARLASFGLALEAAASLRAAEFAPELAQAVERLAVAGEGVGREALSASEDTPDSPEAAGDEPVFVPGEGEGRAPMDTAAGSGLEQAGRALFVGGGGMSCTCDHEVQIRRKPAFFNASPYEHSATWLKVYTVVAGRRSLFGSLSTSNHGTSAVDASMSLKCARTYRRADNYTAMATLPCTTAWGLGANNHFCNDDTLLQYRAVRDNVVQSAQSATCSDAPNRVAAPSCD